MTRPWCHRHGCHMGVARKQQRGLCCARAVRHRARWVGSWNWSPATARPSGQSHGCCQTLAARAALILVPGRVSFWSVWFLSSPCWTWCKPTRHFYQCSSKKFSRVLSPAGSFCASVKCVQEKVRRRMAPRGPFLYFLQTRWHHTDPATAPDKGSPRKCLEGQQPLFWYCSSSKGNKRAADLPCPVVQTADRVGGRAPRGWSLTQRPRVSWEVFKRPRATG